MRVDVLVVGVALLCSFLFAAAVVFICEGVLNFHNMVLLLGGGSAGWILSDLVKKLFERTD